MPVLLGLLTICAAALAPFSNDDQPNPAPRPDVSKSMGLVEANTTAAVNVTVAVLVAAVCAESAATEPVTIQVPAGALAATVRTLTLLPVPKLQLDEAVPPVTA